MKRRGEVAVAVTDGTLSFLVYSWIVAVVVNGLVNRIRRWCETVGLVYVSRARDGLNYIGNIFLWGGWKGPHTRGARGFRGAANSQKPIHYQPLTSTAGGSTSTIQESRVPILAKAVNPSSGPIMAPAYSYRPRPGPLSRLRIV